MEITIILIIGIIFISAFVRSTFGFGDALIAMPLLAMVIPLNQATPFVGLCAICYSSLILIKEWRNVKFKDVIILIITAFIGIPIGIYFLKGNYDQLMKLVLGFFIALFSLFNIFKPQLFHLKNDKTAFLFGFIGGILGGAYNTNGPPVVIYSALRKWDPKYFRATMQGFFLPTGLMIAIGHAVAGLWTKPVLIHFLYVLPGVVIAVILGGILNRRIKKEAFNKYIFVILLGLSVFLIYQNI
ncbi:MAG: permease [Bacteroidetes bacterium]|nr:permease [Bacteroidota bacterium]|tara:strand:+ start:1004 stop:1729 length:726 start_codon:yes stop_codon:yes gene_type:complete